MNIKRWVKEALAKGKDPHEYVALRAFGVVTPATRDRAMQLNFIHLYGGGGEKLPEPHVEQESQIVDDVEFVGFPAIPPITKHMENFAAAYGEPDPPGSEAGGCWSSEELRQDEEDRQQRAHIPDNGKAGELLYMGFETDPVVFHECGWQKVTREQAEGRIHRVTRLRAMDAEREMDAKARQDSRRGSAFLPSKNENGRRVGLVKYTIRVYQDGSNLWSDYDVLATRSLDARCMAFVLDGGMDGGMDNWGWDDDHVELAIIWTELVEMDV